jgi:hypothetical protein
MSADFVSVLQSFATGLNASNPEHQEMARQMIKGLADEPRRLCTYAVKRLSDIRHPRPTQSAPHLVNG